MNVYVLTQSYLCVPLMGLKQYILYILYFNLLNLSNNKQKEYGLSYKFIKVKWDIY